MPDLLEVVLRTVVTVAAIIAFTRINGLRSFSKMSAFDFAITVATGSVLASAILSPSKDYGIAFLGLGSLFIVQGIMARVRARSEKVQHVLDNEPLLVMENGEVLDDNLCAVNMTTDDLYAKLREANAFDLSRIKAVVVESTGDVSVLHGRAEEGISDCVMKDVRRSV